VQSRPTEAFPIVQRSGIRLFRKVAQSSRGIFHDIGVRTFFLRDIARGFAEPRSYAAETIRQMRFIGVDSVPLTLIVAAFIGGIIALQTRYQLFPGVELSLVGMATRGTILLELGPLLTALILTGRVGARMTAEIGTMRVTEQIDALETLSYDPVAFLVVPRLIAATIMLPLLVILANAMGIFSGGVVAVFATDLSAEDYIEGTRLGFTNFQLFYSLLKATMFGAAIALVCSYEGYITGAGAEGVGRSTARAVVITTVTIVFLDGVTAAVLAPYLQG
jgi:phospholipid/cholesterol/gamma-HCH transport system permease protein